MRAAEDDQLEPDFGRILKGPRNIRTLRLMKSLWRAGTMREDCDRITGASNSPQYIAMLRRKFGLEIPCEIVERTDRDGRPSFPGRYALTDQDRARIVKACCAAAN